MSDFKDEAEGLSISTHNEGSTHEGLGQDHEVSDRIITIPNILSFLRLIGVPFFLVLILRGHDIAAIIFLAAASLTDFIDGQIARRCNQMSKLGQVLDPAADRLYILAIVVGLAVRGIVPWLLLVLLLGRDLMLLTLVPALKKRGYISLPVHFLGKAATFFLLIALPLLMVGSGDWAISNLCQILGWGFAVWGTFLYWWAGFLYVAQTIRLVKSEKQV